MKTKTMTINAFKRAARILNVCAPARTKRRWQNRSEAIRRFLAVVDAEATPVPSISIPEREERNAR